MKLGGHLAEKLGATGRKDSISLDFNSPNQIHSQVVHTLANGLAVIIGHCDLLKEYLKTDSGCTERVDVIKAVAHSMAKELHKHQC
jgi:hypothetical protein